MCNYWSVLIKKIALHIIAIVPTFFPTDSSITEAQSGDQTEVDSFNKQTPDLIDVIGSGNDMVQPDEQMKRNSRKRVANPERWKKNSQRRLRSEGNQYMNYKGRIQPAKAPRPCDCTRCRFKCSDNLPEEIRTSICKDLGSIRFQSSEGFLIVHNKHVWC